MLAVVIRRGFALIISSLTVSLDSHPAKATEAKGRNSTEVHIHLKSLSPSIAIEKVQRCLTMTKT